MHIKNKTFNRFLEVYRFSFKKVDTLIGTWPLIYVTKIISFHLVNFQRTPYEIRLHVLYSCVICIEVHGNIKLMLVNYL